MRKSYRVKSEKDFQQVFESGNSVANRAFVIYKVEKAENRHFRVGISVGKKVGHTAVARNRLKRYIRAVIDEKKLEIDPHADFLIITRPYARNFDMVKVRKNLLHALALAHIIAEMPAVVEENWIEGHSDQEKCQTSYCRFSFDYTCCRFDRMCDSRCKRSCCTSFT